MKVAFFSNYLNHHQLAFCKAMCKLTNNNFTFVATEPISKERLDMGYEDMNHLHEFALCTYDSEENEKMAGKLALECDVIITGSAPEKYTIMRIEQQKLTFRYSERVYKNGLWRVLSPRGYRVMHKKHTQFKNSPLYMLCASSYAAADYALQGAYINKTYKWGYFPEVKQYDIKQLIKNKISMQNSMGDQSFVSIVWAGRLIDWKHPEAAIALAEDLKKKGYNFELSIIGNGILEGKLREMILKKNLSSCVKLLGAMPPEEVRKHMEKGDIFLFTSDYNEGWGAVLNEAMNSGCAIVASHAIGSVPYLIEDNKNGVIYKNGSQKSLNHAVLRLINNPRERQKMGINAYYTMVEQWNADTAAFRFLELCQNIQLQKDKEYTMGPCSPAERIFQWNMYKYCKRKKNEFK